MDRRSDNSINIINNSGCISISGKIDSTRSSSIALAVLTAVVIVITGRSLMTILVER